MKTTEFKLETFQKKEQLQEKEVFFQKKNKSSDK
jgi:hypothetical protein